jgi:pimeloyl-ACP methyl ester carboxylesterase
VSWFVERGPLAGLSPRRRLLVTAVVAVVALFATGLAAVLFANSLLHDRRLVGGAVPPSDRPGPVVLVPGYGGGRTGLLDLAERLRQRGRDARVMTLPGAGTGDLREQAAALETVVSDLLADGAPSVDVVGYSAGGVVARVWAREYDGPSRARRIVTLGAPHDGAELAATAASVAPERCPDACQQLVPDSDLLRELADDPVGSAPRWVSIASQVDETVPPASARLVGALNVVVQDVCPAASVPHGALPTDPLSAGLVLDVLGPEPVQQPTRADCATLRALGSR